MVIPHGFRRFLQVGTIFLSEELQQHARHLADPAAVQSAGSIQRARHPGSRLPQLFG
jgi:hypothetical protein